MTAQDIITRALVIIGEMAPGETPNTDEVADALTTLNNLLALWNTIELHVFVITNYQHALTGAKATYAMGTGAGDFNTPRPVKIESAGVILGGVRTPLELIDAKKYAAIKDKAASSLVPEVLYNDNAYPNANLSVWPVPSGTPTLDLYIWGEFSAFATAGDTADFPPGYIKAMTYNLAVDLAPEYGRTPDPTVLAIATQSLAALRALNASNEAATEAPPPMPQQ